MTVVTQAGGWLVEQALVLAELPVPFWLGPAAGWLDALLVAVPAVLLAVLPKAPVIRVTGRAWAGAAVLLGVLACARAVPVQHGWLYLLVLAGLAWAAALVLRARLATTAVLASPKNGCGCAQRATTAVLASPKNGNEHSGSRSHAACRSGYQSAFVSFAGRARTFGGCAQRAGGPVVAALAAGLAALAPWLSLAALGGPVETLAAAVAAAALGRLAARLIPRFPGPRWRAVLLGGLVAAVVLTLLAAGTGASGVPLLALVALPALGFPAAALSSSPRAASLGAGSPHASSSSAGSPRAVAVLVGLGAFGPLAFVAPLQTALFLGFEDVGFWGLVAAAVALVVALLSGVWYGIRVPGRVTAAVTVLVTGATALVGYGTLGHPGLYGDQLFVVLRTQADLSNLAPDLPTRRSLVYQRLVETADRTQAPLRRDLGRLHIAFTPFYLVNGLQVSGGPAVRAWLARRPEVDRVLLNPRLRPLPATPHPLSGSLKVPDRPQWNVTTLGADKVWASGDTGQGVTVGTSDSGVDGTHPALANGFRGGDDSWYDPWNGTRTPTDEGGHGTHTLGSAVGRGGIGVAPGASWVGCVNLARDLGSPAGYLRCLQFMLAPFPYGGDPLRDGRPARAADVLTNSWACPPVEGCDAESLHPAIDALTAAGIFVVAAAGNTGPRCGSVTDPPARYPEALTVGAVDKGGRVAGFSSRSDGKPELLAPGAGVVSALPGGGYAALDGTSMAAPHVAGVVALMWAANPKLVGDVTRTRQLLMQTGTPTSGVTTCGAPTAVVNADAAVRAARTG